LRSRKTLSALVLLAVGVLLTVANAWFAAARSTIPLALDGVVTTMELRREKHPGRDDVFLLTLQSRSPFQVDEAIYRAVAIGERLHKARWSKELTHDGHTLALDWSRDCRGMVMAMPAVVLILVATCLTAMRQKPAAES
jgi:hypothetical protein